MTGTRSSGVATADPPPRRSRRVSFTTAERRARGKAARSEIPRSAHGAWEPASIRRDPVELLEEQAQTRLPELVPIRYGRMLVSPFTFFRGAAYLMAADLADGAADGPARAALRRRPPLELRVLRRSGSAPRVQRQRLRRDAARTVRMGCQTAGGELRGRRQGSRVQRATPPVVLATVRAYRDAMARFAVMRNIDVWYARLDADGIVEQFSAEMTVKAGSGFEADRGQGADERQLPGVREALSRGRRRTAHHRRPAADHADRGHLARGRARARRRGHPRALSAPTRSHPARRSAELLERYRYVHAARKVVGVGSVGTRAWILLLLGRDDDDPLFLQFKEAQPSVSSRSSARAAFEQHGQRVVEGQRMMQAAPTSCSAGTDRGDRRRDEGLLHPPALGREGLGGDRAHEPRRPQRYGAICGWTLARAHARSGDPVAISAYLGAGTPSTTRWRCSRDLRRPERARLPGPSARRKHRSHRR